MVITGFNGIGKSTLLKTLIGQISVLGGDYRISEQVRIGYFEQDLVWEDGEKIPIQLVAHVRFDMVIKEIRGHLANFIYNP